MCILKKHMELSEHNCLDFKKKSQTVKHGAQKHGCCTAVVTPNKNYAAWYCL